MKADPKGVLTGSHFLDGDDACCEGALAAGCRFVAGYPITPSTSIIERYVRRAAAVGGVFIQMEDEIASSIAILGAVWAGAKAMTVTSGPGFSLMMENIGYAAMTETPSVYVDVQRGGPSTGLPTLPGQGDMMQCRWGSHGDYEVIALVPNSPQECFDLTVKAFNLAETYRVPVMMMMDEGVGHMTERVVIPESDEIDVTRRRYTSSDPEEYRPYEPEEDGVPGMIRAGDGYRVHITGLTHDEKGYPVMNAETQGRLVRRIVDKIRLNAANIIDYEEDGVEDAEVVVLSYGISSRVALKAIEMARAEGARVGMLRLRTVWPFPEQRIRELAPQVRAFVVPEINYGQVVLEVERCAAGAAPVLLIPHGGGGVHNPERIFQVLKGQLS